MKIDADTIDHNTLRLINELSDEVGSYGYTESELLEAKNYSYASLNYICGVMDMANAMKEVLKN